MQKKMARVMMDDFLRRQEEYENIYKTYQFSEPTVKKPIDQGPHQLRDIVRKCQTQYQDQQKLLREKQRKEKYLNDQQSNIQKEDQRRRPTDWRENAKKNKQIDLNLVLIIAIPLIFFFTLLSELI